MLTLAGPKDIGGARLHFIDVRRELLVSAGWDAALKFLVRKIAIEVMRLAKLAMAHRGEQFTQHFLLFGQGGFPHLPLRARAHDFCAQG